MVYGMIEIRTFSYDTIIEKIQNSQSNEVVLVDIINGFNDLYQNSLLERVDQYAKEIQTNIKVYYHQILPEEVKNNYQNLDIIFDLQNQYKRNFKALNFEVPDNTKNFNNFLCCFLGSEHVSRQFLCSILAKMKIWNNNFCTKNFKFDIDTLDGNVRNFISGDLEKLYNKFFIDQNLKQFYQSINTINYTHCDNKNNFLILQEKINSSFVHVIGECIGTSSVPYVTEKFLQSIITKGLFIGYAQPLWHKTLFDCYGFKPYNKVFNYNFDYEKNPIVRLVKLMEMLLKYQKLSTHDWHDLYHLEKDNLEYNYHHYRSEDYLKNLAKFI